MSGFIGMLAMSALLGAASFGIGMLPLSFSFSRSALAQLSALGTGLLLGAALGVIIPEGIETLALSDTNPEFPTAKIALSLLVGFTFMLVIEQFLLPHSHSHPNGAHIPVPHKPSQVPTNSPDVQVEFDVELGELERTEGLAPESMPAPPLPGLPAEVSSRSRAYPLTLGLVMHALADGLALGSSALPGSDASGETNSPFFSSLSIVVFFALIIHKAPTALALTTSLLSTGLPRNECRRHVALFSASTPVGTLVTYLLLTFLGTGSSGHWPGVALLVSGGTFLYVATVLQPVSNHASEDISPRARVLFVILGMFVPFVVGAIIGHGHE